MLATLMPIIRFLRQATSQATSATFMRCLTILACWRTSSDEIHVELPGEEPSFQASNVHIMQR